MSDEIPKPKMGKPPTVNATSSIVVRVTAAMRAAIEQRAQAQSVTLSEAARRLIEVGLKVSGRARPRK